MTENKGETASSPAQEEPSVARTAPADGVTHEELAELRELTSSLLQAVGTMQAQDARAQQFRSLVEDVRTAARTMAVTGPALRESAVPQEEHGGDCGCGPCACVSSDCCLFEIVMTHARVTEMQIEPVDSNVFPNSEMELKFFASIDGIGGVYPSLWGSTPFRKNIGQPGLWASTRLKLGTVSVCKGQPKTFTIDLDVVEVDDGGLEATAARDEHGSNSGSMTLDCCLSMPVTLTIDVELNHGGLGRGAVEGKFEARKICC